MTTTTRIALAAIALTTFACAPDLRSDDDGEDAGAHDAGPVQDGSIPPSSGPFRHTVNDDGTITTIVDATEGTAYLDLESGLAVTPADPLDSRDWDLAFTRFSITTNGGASGTGGAAAARLPAADFDALDAPPETGWIADGVDIEEDTDAFPESAFNGGVEGVNDWYDYDRSSHRLTPRDVVFVVRSVEGHFFKLRIDGYYDDAGTPAVIAFRWARIGGGDVELPDAGPPDRPDAGGDAGVDPIPGDAITIDASARDAFVYLRVGAGVVTITDPETSLDWDLAIRRTLIRTNSGESGAGLGGARSAGAVELERVIETDTIGFVVDDVAASGIPGAPAEARSPILASWYDYDPTTHAVTPKDETFVVRTARGEYARLRIWSWEDGTFRLSLEAIDVVPQEHAIEVEASTSGSWAYVDLHAAAVVTIAEPATDATWDLALSRTLYRTSSGTSGPGQGGAIDTNVADPATVLELPSEGFVADDERTMPGPPGSPTYSGNGALEGWYAYDPTTHAVSPRATTYAIRLADGSVGRLVIRAYASGRSTLGWTYAGPGRTTVAASR
ncbi:HmuY family protein [Sandaracinus amylolyticus]|uniref:Lipoprotein n=1 Tax=Sandaracinus amylolyticus TaxID=927083 RepID=A0A0F6W732_9BACT|nr:HmuY family protein [Sandaracinus amylolyticus]AKF09092.1 hypothetical protein DB32_006241 [Sandaracinus amylolyticus]